MRSAIVPVLLAASILSTEAAVIHVRPGGHDAASGLSWSDAKATVGAAIQAAASGDEIWVAEGTYNERIRNRIQGGLAVEVALYGGFEADEISRDERDVAGNPTILDGGAGGSVVTIDAQAGPAMRVDGFRIRNGYATFGGGIQITTAAPTIANNDILGSQADFGGGIEISAYRTIPPVAHATIVSNLIQVNRGGSGGGAIAVIGASPEIRGNTILRNTTGGEGGGIGVWVTDSSKVSRPTIAGNFIYENVANLTTPAMIVGGGGIYATERNIAGEPVSFGICAPRIQDNVIGANAAIACGGGIAVVNDQNEAAVIVNNTVVGNSGSGICWGNAGPTIVNNIVAGNTWGLEQDVANPISPTIRNNDVFGNVHHGKATDYFLLDDRTGTDGNLSVDPLLLRFGARRQRIEAASPCRDAGDDSTVGAGRADIDGEARIQGAHVDIGADESDGSTWTDLPAIIRVAPEGNDANDGSSWAAAKAQVQSALDAAWLAGGGEVWVKEGTYAEHLTLAAWVDLYGGFAGGESARSQRDPAAHTTVLDGGQVPPVVRCGNTGYRVSVLDGFRITNGGRFTGGWPLPPPSSPAAWGGGIRCTVASPIIRGNEITRNSLGDPATAPFDPGEGGGIGLVGSHALIESNTITENEVLNPASVGGGVYGEWAAPDLVGNTIARNRGPDGAGVYIAYGRPMLQGNAIDANEHYYLAGVYAGSLRGAVTLISNWDFDVDGNTFTNNVASNGGALHMSSNERGRVSNNVFASNWGWNRQMATGDEGGAIWLLIDADPQEDLWITGNTFVDNHATSFYSGELGAAIAVLPMSTRAVIANNIMAFNTSGVYVRFTYSTYPTLVRNDMFNTGVNYRNIPPGPTDILVDPLFVDRTAGDYRLAASSPALDASNPGYIVGGADHDGAPRVQDGDGDGTDAADLGSHEYSPDHDLDGDPDWSDPDDDGDGALDAADCAPWNPVAWATPAEVAAVTVDGTGPTVLTWADGDPATVFDVVRGSLAEVRADGDFSRAACAVDDGDSPTWADTAADPPEGDARYYLVRASSVCGDGGWGARVVGACP